MSEGETSPADGSRGETSPVADALAKLKAAMGASGGTTTDPDRRRAAMRLADLVRTDDAELGRFARRHLPGRHIDDDTLKDLRDLAVGLSRLIAVQGNAPEASALIGAVRMVLLPRVEELERAAATKPVQLRVAEVDPAPNAMPIAPIPRSPLPASPPHAALPPSPARFPAHDPFSETLGEVGVPISPSMAVPFKHAPDPSDPAVPTSKPPEPLSPVSKPSEASLSPPNDPAPPKTAAQINKALSATMTSDVLLVPRGPALPFAEPKKEPPAATLPPHLARIDAASHAVFSALILVYPQRQGEIHAQYGIRNPVERELLDRYWGTKLAEDKALAAQWMKRRDEAIRYYRAQK